MQVGKGPSSLGSCWFQRSLARARMWTARSRMGLSHVKRCQMTKNQPIFAARPDATQIFSPDLLRVTKQVSAPAVEPFLLGS
jgi:hypothetical protein